MEHAIQKSYGTFVTVSDRCRRPPESGMVHWNDPPNGGILYPSLEGLVR
jgi:hypothetical protein